MKLRLTTLLVLCSILVGCTEEYSGVVLKRGGLLYKPNSTEPLTARVEQFHDNGRLHKTYTSVDGKKEGLERWWHENGQLNRKTTYVDGKLEGLDQWWWLENTQLSSESCFRAGEKTDMSYCKKEQQQ
jgi:antitoxin component YwqK of YwqJK toxin-antitoxin module